MMSRFTFDSWAQHGAEPAEFKPWVVRHDPQTDIPLSWIDAMVPMQYGTKARTNPLTMYLTREEANRLIAACHEIIAGLDRLDAESEAEKTAKEVPNAPAT